MTPRILSLGEAALTVEFAPGFDDAARAAVVRLDAAIAAAREAGGLPAVLDVVPTFRSLTVHYDPAVATRAAIEPVLATLTSDTAESGSAPGARWRFPVAYGGAQGPDLADLAEAAGLSEAEAIALHAETPVTVHMLGFLPGFAFMGDIAEPLRRPRRAEPRTRVPAGSVAVADRLTAVYPWESPGGWHLIGLCPVPLFDAARERPALLSPADRVTFEPVSADRVAALSEALASGDLDPDSFREEA